MDAMPASSTASWVNRTITTEAGDETVYEYLRSRILMSEFSSVWVDVGVECDTRRIAMSRVR